MSRIDVTDVRENEAPQGAPHSPWRTYLSGLWLIVTLELRQRARGVAWYVLLGIFILLVAAVTVLVWISTSAWETGGGPIYSIVVMFVLLLGTLVSPALSGNAINGDREAGTLATTQVTLITTGQLVLGKFVAAWITALAFLVAAVPFLCFAVILGKVSVGTILISILVLAIELGVIAAVGVGLSGVLGRGLFSIVVTYLVVAALSVGTLITFTLLGSATRSEATSVFIDVASSSYDSDTGAQSDIVCAPPVTSTYQVPRFDLYWWVLAANPYVVVADSSPTASDESGYPADVFGWISYAVRSAQESPELHNVNDYCAQAALPNQGYNGDTTPDPRDVYDRTVPSWFVGLGIHLLMGAGALFWAWRRTSTPARRLPAGSRIA